MIKLTINYYLILLFILPVFSSFLMKFWNPSDVIILHYADELVLILTLPLAIRGFINLVKQKFGFQFFLLFFLYLILGLFLSLIHQTPIGQVLYQIALELKYPLIVCAAYGITTLSHGLILNKFINFSKAVILISIPLILWQFISPSTYDQFFPGGAHKGMFIMTDETALARSAGVFWFTGELAIFSGFLFCYFFFLFHQHKKSSDAFWLIITLTVLFSTLSRLEILGTFLGIWVALYITQKDLYKISYVLASLIIAPMILITIFPLLHAIYIEQGLKDIQSSMSARAVFYYYSFIISSMYFPFGSGLGTYGGQAAAIFDSDMYFLLGFEYYGWYNLKIQMTDTFWPHILGETGFVGLILFGATIFVLLNKSRKILYHTKKTNRTDVFVISAASISSLILLLTNSLASPVFYSFFSLLPAMMFFSQSVYLEQQSSLHALLLRPSQQNTGMKPTDV